MRTTSWHAAATLTIALAALTALHSFWLPSVGGFLVVADPLEPADAIVPLAGERSRVYRAADLFKEGYATWFVITDMRVPNPAVSYSESVRGQAIEAGVPPDHVVMARGLAADTYQEAQNLRLLAQEQHWRSLAVVTSPFHTRRARLILRREFKGTGIDLSVYPVPEHWYRPERWWMTSEGRQVTAEEYLKLALYLLGYHRFADP